MTRARITIGNIKPPARDETTIQDMAIREHVTVAGTTPRSARLIPIRQVSR